MTGAAGRWLVDVASLAIAVIVGLPWVLWRRLRGRPVLLRARLSGFPTSPKGQRTIWVHGVSVGEVLAARRLIPLLEERRAPARVVVSTTTAAGLGMARQVYADRSVFACPLDLRFVVRRALRAVRPEMLVLVDLELWPVLLEEAAAEGIPVVVVSGKVSARSTRGYRRLLRVSPRFLDPITLFCVQDGPYVARLASLGIGENRVRSTGSIKVDNLMEAPDRDAVRRAMGLDDEPLVVAGSTHKGEEEVVLAAFEAIQRRIPSCRLVIAPRHVERAEAVDRLVAKSGRKPVRKARWQTNIDENPSNSVLVVDTMGELATMFAAADVVFLGGSLVPVGGHNVLEPAACSVPIVMGPEVFTVTEVADQLRREGAARVVGNDVELASAILEWLEDPASRARAGAAARRVVEGLAGATERTVAAIEEIVATD